MMEEKARTDPAGQRKGAVRVLGYAPVFPLILVFAGGSILGFGWFRQVESAQTIGAVIAGIGFVALLSRFLRGHAGK